MHDVLFISFCSDSRKWLNVEHLTRLVKSLNSRISYFRKISVSLKVSLRFVFKRSQTTRFVHNNRRMEHTNGYNKSDNADLNGKIRDWLKWDKVSKR